MTKKTKNNIKKFAKKMSLKVGERFLLILVLYTLFRLFNVSLRVGF